MPNSPSVKFIIENNNIPTTVPLVGVSCFFARTTKGPYNDPSKLISNPSQFKETFGDEIVPDGSVSNIEKALSGGSKVRIIRVPGTGYFKGVLNAGAAVSTTPSNAPVAVPTMKLTYGTGDDVTYVEIGFYTKTYDELIDGVSTFDVIFSKQANTLFYSITGTGKTTVMESNPVMTYKSGNTVNKTNVDYLSFSNFLKNSSYLEPVIIDSSEGFDNPSIDGVIKWLTKIVDNSNKGFKIEINTLTTTTNPGEGGSVTTSSNWVELGVSVDSSNAIISQRILGSTPGSSGTAPTAEAWINSMDYLKDYTEPYQVICSHLDQHLEDMEDVLSVHKAFKEMCDELQEYTYYIEVPKYTTHYSQGTQVRNRSSIISWVETCIGTIGNSMWVSYFAGGIKYYNEDGNLVNSDCIGSIAGLGDTSASLYGPWKSFAGMNRGVLYDGVGPACANYGSPSRYDELNELANNHVNMIVVKNTPSSGNQTMLWHCFTSQVKQDSFKYLSIVRLILYMKKYLRPILESYIEEPNIWHTWNRIYLEVKPWLNDLVSQSAISEYTWQGDQDATSYGDLVINKEADVRQGKYKVILKFKEVVPLQEISMVLSIDKVSNTTSAELVTE